MAVQAPAGNVYVYRRWKHRNQLNQSLLLAWVYGACLPFSEFYVVDVEYLPILSFPEGYISPVAEGGVRIWQKFILENSDRIS